MAFDYTRWILSAGVALALTAPAGASSREESVPALVEVTALAPTVRASALARQTEIDLVLEYQVGLFAYRTIADTKLTVIEGQDSTIQVKFNGEPYIVRFSVRGEALRPEGDVSLWALEVVRQDTIDERPSSEPKTNFFVIERDGRIRFRSTGSFRTQGRNFRLTFALFE